ncbi:MAG: NADPH-dependent FMN reductase [Solirubrobacteraceae bacterium]
MTDRSPPNRRILLISGSARAGSTNTAVLRTAAAVAPTGVETVWFDGLQRLPLFNPDDDVEGAAPHPEVASLRAAVQAGDGVLICTPEYAGALPAALKNLLEWTIGDAGTYGKPVAWINASGPAAPTGGADAHASLAKVLAYAGADVVADACLRLPMSRDQVGADGLLADEGQRREIAGAVSRLAARRPQV